MISEAPTPEIPPNKTLELSSRRLQTFFMKSTELLQSVGAPGGGRDHLRAEYRQQPRGGLRQLHLLPPQHRPRQDQADPHTAGQHQGG